MLMNNVDPEVAENPDELVVYGGTGRAAGSWDAFDAIVRELQALADDETLLVQRGKPVAVFRTHEWAPRQTSRPTGRPVMRRAQAATWIASLRLPLTSTR